MISIQELGSRVEQSLTLSKAEALATHQRLTEAGWKPKYMELLFNNGEISEALVERTVTHFERLLGQAHRFTGAVAIDGCVAAYDDAIRQNDSELAIPGIAIWTQVEPE